MQREYTGLLILLAITASISARADSTDTTEVRYGKPAEPIDRPAPTYPGSALRAGDEGWVMISFVVAADGTVVDPVVIESTGIRAFEREALRVTREWTFKPATLDGKPVDHRVDRTLITFAIETDRESRGARPAYMNFSRKFNKALEKGDLEQAEALLSYASKKGGWNLYESGRLWIASYQFADAVGDEQEALRSIRRAAFSRQWLRPETGRELLKTQFALEIEKREFADALKTYATISAEYPDTAGSQMYVDVIQQLRQAIDGPRVIASDASLPAGDGEEAASVAREHGLLRRSAAIEVRSGRIDQVDFRCDYNRAIDTVAPDRVWNLPESWGDCDVVVSGQPGTDYRLLELPRDEAAPAASASSSE